jgi:amidase
MLAASRRLAGHFETCDVLALPTTPMLPFAADDSLTWLERIARNADALVNTAVFDHTGNPALTVPCGTRRGLPVGVQFVGPRFAEPTLYRVGAALEGAT